MHILSVYKQLTFVVCIACLAKTACFAAEPELKSGIDKSNFDLSLKPGDDFYNFVNGEWIKRNPIPPEYGRWGAFPKLRDDNLAALREILEELVNTKEGLNEERTKLRDFYETAMDEETIRKLGMSPLEPSLKRIDGIKSKNDLIVEAGRLREHGIATLFSFFVEQD
jgi:putative endopeptidase